MVKSHKTLYIYINNYHLGDIINGIIIIVARNQQKPILGASHYIWRVLGCLVSGVATGYSYSNSPNDDWTVIFSHCWTHLKALIILPNIKKPCVCICCWRLKSLRIRVCQPLQPNGSTQVSHGPVPRGCPCTLERPSRIPFGQRPETNCRVICSSKNPQSSIWHSTEEIQYISISNLITQGGSLFTLMFHGWLGREATVAVLQE